MKRATARYYYPSAALGTVLLGTLIMSLALPQFTRPLFTGLIIFQPRAGGAATVGEAAPRSSISRESSLWPSIQSNFPACWQHRLSRPSSWLWSALSCSSAVCQSQRPVDLSASHLVCDHSGHGPGPEQVRLLLRSQCSPAHRISGVLAHAERRASAIWRADS